VPGLLNNDCTNKVKQLRSSIEDLRWLFDRGITLRDIAEPLASFDDGQSALEVRGFLDSKEYDVVGVRRKGMIEGYALRSELREGTLGEFAQEVEPGAQLSDSTALLSVFELLRDRSWVFVTILDQVWGIVTRGDLHKAPVRMWVFCLISLAEMHTLRLVRNRYPREEWIGLKYVSDGRLEEARKLFNKRKAKNEEADLTDCLQLCDEATILVKTGDVLRELGFESKAKAKAFFSEVESLRNPLAHAQDIITNRWPELADIAFKLENFLKACEAMQKAHRSQVLTGVTP
jgi:hypothetical protein